MTELADLPMIPLPVAERIKLDGKVVLKSEVVGTPVRTFRGHWFATGKPMTLSTGTEVVVMAREGMLHELCEVMSKLGRRYYRVHARGLTEAVGR